MIPGNTITPEGGAREGAGEDFGGGLLRLPTQPKNLPGSFMKPMSRLLSPKGRRPSLTDRPHLMALRDRRLALWLVKCD